MSMKELQSAMRDWADVLETYRAANRAVADAAMVKVWDAGWRAGAEGREGRHRAGRAAGDAWTSMARREHDRWMAERLDVRLAADGAKAKRATTISWSHDKIAPGRR